MSAPPVESKPDVQAAPAAVADTESKSRLSWLQLAERFPRWWWLAVPALAIIAYITVLRIGFLSDDYILLYDRHANGLNLEALLPRPYPYWRFYRPAGWLITWDIGWLAWGYNPLPYHVLGLILHAAVSLVAGLCAAAITSRRTVGWLAGALFAVFPLHMEAAGWLAAQYDEWATLFGLLSLLLFVRWWQKPTGSRALYAGSFACFVLGLLSKESLLSWLPVLGLGAWVVTPVFDKVRWRGLLVALAPFLAVLVGYVALRISLWGNLGNYPRASTNYGDFFWDSIVNDVRLIISPLNPAIFGKAASQIVGAPVSAVLLYALVRYGKPNARVLALAGAWVVLGLLPVLNLPVVADSLENNRYLYLPSAGYCLGLAVLIYAACMAARTWQAVGALVAALLVLGCIVSWIQLVPWHTATVLARESMNELHNIVPPSARPQTWYVESLPDRYKGAYVFLQGANLMRFFSDGDLPDIKNTPDAAGAKLNEAPNDAFALRFAFSPADTRYHVTYAAGITTGDPPPTGQGVTTWDFTSCGQSARDAWRVKGAMSTCEPGKGLLMQNPTTDAQLLGPTVKPEGSDGARFLRLRASVSYPPGTKADIVGQWYLHGPAESWNEKRSGTYPVRADGEPHVYWTYVPAPPPGNPLALRFDPADNAVTAGIQWLSIDVVR